MNKKYKSKSNYCEQNCKIPKSFFFKKKWAIPGLFFLYFRLFNTVDIKQMLDKSLLMTGIEPRISGVEGDRSTN